MVSRLLKMVCDFNQMKNNKTLNKERERERERERLLLIKTKIQVNGYHIRGGPHGTLRLESTPI